MVQLSTRPPLCSTRLASIYCSSCNFLTTANRCLELKIGLPRIEPLRSRKNVSFTGSFFFFKGSLNKPLNVGLNGNDAIFLLFSFLLSLELASSAVFGKNLLNSFFAWLKYLLISGKFSVISPFLIAASGFCSIFSKSLFSKFLFLP